MDNQILKQIIRNPKLADKLLPTPERAFEQLMQKLMVTYNYKTDSTSMDNKPISDSVVLSKLKISLNGYDPHEIGSLIKDLLVIWKHQQELSFINKIESRLSAKTFNNNGIEAWVKALTGEVGQLDVAVMKHFVWQVKRKMGGLAVEQHMMPVLFGPSGGGKSVAVSQLLSPVADVTITTDMGIFDDPFAKRMLSRNFVVFFDELQGSNGVDINHMKQIITATNVEWRVMRSEQVQSAPQNATFIGCSNDPVKERICDPTSARRFWELKCKAQIDWDGVNAIDYRKLWRSIDTHSECPVKSLIPEIRAAQQLLIK